MSVVVFLGPSLPREQAARLLDATYLPPVQQGDLLRLLDHPPRHVGIIDGYFETVPAVWHKEILIAMSRGVRVYGAASMGALRAAELHGFGMRGVGTIFEWYRDGRITADDEVAVQHAPEGLGYLPLTQALVDIRASTDSAREAGLIGPEAAAAIVAAARALYYAERNVEAVAARLHLAGTVPAREIAAWQEHARTDFVSLKARDAAALLAEIGREAAQPWEPRPVDYTVAHTVFVERLLNEVALERAGGRGPVPAALRESTLLALLARAAAREFGWSPGPDELTEAAGALFARLGLSGPAQVEAWMQAHGLSEAAVWARLRDDLLVARLMRRHEVEIARALPEALRLARAVRAPGDQEPGAG
ncbi:TfuA-like protein [Methylobacterium sp.]|uniref:TfuA-like protein n=1 Tax=Methylobacterium sp. TaxID=409 RepID=UPI0025866D8E|nr:TfuA-like protein [Methylobacterium sp.]